MASAKELHAFVRSINTFKVKVLDSERSYEPHDDHPDIVRLLKDGTAGHQWEPYIREYKLGKEKEKEALAKGLQSRPLRRLGVSIQDEKGFYPVKDVDYITGMMEALISKDKEVADSKYMWPPFWEHHRLGFNRDRLIRFPTRKVAVPDANFVTKLQEMNVRSMVRRLREKGIPCDDPPELDFEGKESQFDELRKWAKQKLHVTFDHSINCYKHNAPLHWKGVTCLQLEGNISLSHFQCEHVKEALIEANVRGPPANLDRLLECRADQELVKRHAMYAWREEFTKWFHIQMLLLERQGPWVLQINVSESVAT